MHALIGLMIALMNLSAHASSYYVVSQEGKSQSYVEKQAVLMRSGQDWEPLTLDALKSSPVPIILPTNGSQTWEMDLPIVMPDGNIVHLVGPAIIKPSVEPALHEFKARIAATNNSHCQAVVNALVSQHVVLAQTMKIECMGRVLNTSSALMDGGGL